MDNGDIFSLLFKWAKSTEERDSKTENENYCTQALNIVLAHLLNRSSEDCRLKAVATMNDLFAKQVGFSFENSDRIIVEAHKKTSGGVPDMTIQTQNGKKLIYVEIKVDSPVYGDAKDRIGNYARALSENRQAVNKGLLLVTRSGHEPVPSIDGIRFAQVSWFDVSGQLLHAWQELSQIESAGVSAVFLLEQFYNFLKECGMAILKVDNRLEAATVYNVIKLLSMLECVCEDKELGLRTNQGPRFEVSATSSPDGSSLGYQDKIHGDYAISIYPHNAPDDKRTAVYYEIREKDEIKRMCAHRKDDWAKAVHERADLWEEDNTIAVRLDLEEGFFGEDVSAQHQIESIRGVIMEAKDNWRRLKTSIGRKRR